MCPSTIAARILSCGVVAAAAGMAPGQLYAAGNLRGFNAAVDDLVACYAAIDAGRTPVGANGKPCKTLADAAAAGASLIRLNFSKYPLMDQDESPGDDPTTAVVEQASYRFNDVAFAAMHDLIDRADQQGLKVVIDPHAMPGAREHTTVRIDDELFWFDRNAERALESLWERIARETRAYGDVIHAFDLINEPYSPPRGAQLNRRYRELVQRIRDIDAERHLIIDFYYQHYHAVEGDSGDYRPRRPQYYDPDDAGTDGNARGAGMLLFSTHFYWPLDYTHQGITINGKPPRAAAQAWENPDAVSDGRQWINPSLRQRMSGVRRFADDHGHWRIFIGEFSASACADCAWDIDAGWETPVNGGQEWLTEVTRVFDDYGWDWTYHSLNGASFWDAQQPPLRWGHISYLLGRHTAVRNRH